MTSNAQSHKKSFWEANRRSGGKLLKSALMRYLISILRGLLMFGLCFMIIQPLIMRLASSFMTERNLYDSTIIMLPRNVTLDNYKYVFDMIGMSTYPSTSAFAGSFTFTGSSMLNTLWVSLLMSICQVASCTLVAYGFARYEFPLKKFWFATVVAIIIIPPQTISTALYKYFAEFDFLGLIKLFGGKPINLRTSIVPYTLMSLTCMGLKDGLYIYMLRQYFKNVPKSLEEAAYVDGCSTMRTFTKIMLPDALPTITSCFLFAFVWQWTDIFYSRNFLSTMNILSLKMSNMGSLINKYFNANQESASSQSIARTQQLISIGVVICSIPLIILYCFAQKTFVESIAMTGSKE